MSRFAWRSSVGILHGFRRGEDMSLCGLVARRDTRRQGDSDLLCRSCEKAVA